MEKNFTKRVPVSGEFMTTKLNDNVYGALLILSFATGEGEESKTLVSKIKIEENSPWLWVYTDLDNSKARRKWRDEIKKYIKAGLLKEVKHTTKNGNVIDCYEISKEGRELYYLISSRTLEYLINTKSTHSIRIYSYLMFKYSKNPNYLFTQKEILRNVFNQKSIKNDMLNKKVNDILFDLENSGFFKIDHERYISLNGKATRVKQLYDINYSPDKIEEHFKRVG